MPGNERKGLANLMSRVKKGQTLVETLVAMTIISAAVLVLLAGVTAGAKLLTRAYDMKEADGELSVRAEEQISRREGASQAEITVTIDGVSEKLKVNKISVEPKDSPGMTYEYYYSGGED